MCDFCNRRSFMRGAGALAATTVDGRVAIDAHKVVAEARLALSGVRERTKWR